MNPKQAREELRLHTRLAELRKRAGLSQQDLADKLHVSRQAISLWESGNGMPSIDNLIYLSDFYGVSVDYLLGRTDEAVQKTASTWMADAASKRKRKRVLFAILGAILVLIVLSAALVAHKYFSDWPIEVTPIDEIPERVYALPHADGVPFI